MDNKLNDNGWKSRKLWFSIIWIGILITTLVLPVDTQIRLLAMYFAGGMSVLYCGFNVLLKWIFKDK